MFDVSAWRDVAHVVGWSGLSLGAAGGLGALAWYVAPLRRLAIVGAVAVAAGYGGTIHGNTVGLAEGRVEVQAKWDKAKEAAEAAQALRDTRIAFDLKQTYQPKLDALASESAERKARADTYERKLLALLAKGGKPVIAADRCELGAAAVRVRPRQ
jgi:hypothetical protein